MLNIALFGPPGAGKGTQSKYLIEKYNLTYISTGDILRKEISEGSDFGKQAKDVIAGGNLVSDDLIVKIIEKRIVNESKDGILFDGFPRTVVQAYILDGLLSKLNTSLNFMLSLEVPMDELKVRLVERGKSSGRADDNLEVIEKRLLEYQEKTFPLIDFYKDRGKYISIDGVGNVSDITHKLQSAIDKTLKQRYFNIVITGIPGSGRGTQAKRLAAKYNLAYLSTGKLMRQEIRNETPIGLACKKYVEAGNMVPDEYPIRLIERFIRDNPHVDGYVFKGFPRTVVQAYILDGLLKKLDARVNFAIEIQTRTLTAIKRLSSRGDSIKGRSYDKNTDLIIHRLDQWETTIRTHVSDFYSNQDKLIRIDGETTDQDAIFSDIDNKVGSEIEHY